MIKFFDTLFYRIYSPFVGIFGLMFHWKYGYIYSFHSHYLWQELCSQSSQSHNGEENNEPVIKRKL